VEKNCTPTFPNVGGTDTKQSCPWVGLTHGLGWVGSSTVKVLKIGKDYGNAFIARSVKNTNKLMVGWLKVRDKFCV